MKTLKPIMIVGTSSDVGKSVLSTGLCRIFKQDGYNPAPYKAQNISLNSYVSPEGLEMGRAQATQAEACGIPCHSDMNPLLLKPDSNMSSQVILNGKVAGVQSAKEYFESDSRDELFNHLMQSYHRLADKFSPIVIEGAGSISELNLRSRDIVNMRVALANQADVYLVADIDRGGVFASIYGTLEIIPPEERKLIKGIIINKFRGEAKYFEEGREILEKLCKIPVVGVIPYFSNIQIEEEDSVSLKLKKTNHHPNKINIAIIHLNYISNFTDFDSFEQIEEVNSYYTKEIEEIQKADIIIIPGSKNTLLDLQAIQDNGIFEAIQKLHQGGTSVYGVCGGFQMMGETIEDPFHVEGAISKLNGLGLLPTHTKLSPKKHTQQRTFKYKGSQELCQGYEIHMGQTTSSLPKPLCTSNSDSTQLKDGYFLNNKTWGSYMHGIFDNSCVLQDILQEVGLKRADFKNATQYRDQQYNKLAKHLRQNLDMSYIYKNLKQV